MPGNSSVALLPKLCSVNPNIDRKASFACSNTKSTGTPSLPKIIRLYAKPPITFAIIRSENLFLTSKSFWGNLAAVNQAESK
jgi:hypothetical protein